ncbi:MAG: hypothetical protein SWX82_16795 [Cyanobacteriota bacterium]|nr:hypothetical protein [Cyanobacteriota bacterium]
MKKSQWYKGDTLYQILLVEPANNTGDGEDIKNPRQILKQTLITRTRKEFEEDLLDEETVEKLSNYPKAPPTTKDPIPEPNISSYLPSPGVVLLQELRKKLFNLSSDSGNSENPQLPDEDIININNFYDSLRTLLHCRKTSQLIAKTWYAQNKATKNDVGSTKYWDLFLQGNWKEISKWDSLQEGILDSLIVREIFLSTNKSEPDELQFSKDIKIEEFFSPIVETQERAKFIILPNSTGWQGITLSLLLAGQAYRKVRENGIDKYHQIVQPILSTGEIVGKYNVRVSVEKYHGEIREVPLDYNSPCTTFQVTLPYPPIPNSTNVRMKDIKQWAYASEEDRDLPFYIKEGNEFVIGTGFVAPPYPYIPVSTTC